MKLTNERKAALLDHIDAQMRARGYARFEVLQFTPAGGAKIVAYPDLSGRGGRVLYMRGPKVQS